MLESISNYQKRHEDDQECLKNMENEIYSIQSKLAGKKYSIKCEQTEMTTKEIENLNEQFCVIEEENQKLRKDNEEMIKYIQDLEITKKSMEKEKECRNHKKI